MTREEAKKEIIDMANALQLIPNTPKGKAVSMAIKALEQESVLDKIRAEIEEQKEYRCFDDDDMCIYRTGLDDALYIIDKYKADMKGEE